MIKIKTRYRLKGVTRDSYLGLVLKFPLASIKSEEQLAVAQKVMDQLLAKSKLDDGQELYLDALGDLVAAYEDIHYAIAPASDADMLRHLLEAKGISQEQLSQGAAIAKSTISEILAGKKRFTRQVIGKLSLFFNIPPGVLAGNYLIQAGA